MKKNRNESLRHLYTEKNICAEDILQNLIECGIITETDATKSIMDRKRKEIIETHKQEHTIWEKNGKWMDSDLLMVAKDDQFGRQLQDMNLLTRKRASRNRTRTAQGNDGKS